MHAWMLGRRSSRYVHTRTYYQALQREPEGNACTAQALVLAYYIHSTVDKVVTRLVDEEGRQKGR